jgi:hypothetical protein
MLWELIGSRSGSAILSDNDLLHIAFKLADLAPKGRSNTLIPAASLQIVDAPDRIVTELSPEHVIAALIAHGFSDVGRIEGSAKRFVSAAHAEPGTFSVVNDKICIKNMESFWVTSADIFIRPSIHDIWSMPLELRPKAIRRPRFHDVSTPLPPSDPRDPDVLDVTPMMMRGVLALPTADAILADGDLLVLSFMLAAKLAPAQGTAFSVADLSREIEQSRAPNRPPIADVDDRLRFAARRLSMFDISLFRRLVRLQDLSKFDESLAEILTRPRILRFIDAYLRRERERASLIASRERRPLPPPQEPREPRPKPREMPPPPALPPPVVEVGVVSAESVLEAYRTAAIPQVKVLRDPVKPAAARAAAEHFTLRNGLVELGQVSVATSRYLTVRCAFSVEADERRECEAAFVVCEDGGEPGEVLDFSRELREPSASAGDAALPIEMAAQIAARCGGAMQRAAEPLLREIAVRHASERAPVVSRFAALWAASLQGAAGTAEMEVAGLVAARDAELAALAPRFDAHITCLKMTFSWALMPTTMVSATLRRRKIERAITLRVPATSTRPDHVLCEGCGVRATAKPAACDERAHLLCEACAPIAQGRIACPCCG